MNGPTCGGIKIEFPDEYKNRIGSVSLVLWKLKRDAHQPSAVLTLKTNEKDGVAIFQDISGDDVEKLKKTYRTGYVLSSFDTDLGLEYGGPTSLDGKYVNSINNLVYTCLPPFPGHRDLRCSNRL